MIIYILNGFEQFGKEIKLVQTNSITASASAAMVTPSADTSVSNGVYVPGGITNGDVKPAVSTTPLADFLMQLEEYTPTVSQVWPVELLYAAFTYGNISERPDSGNTAYVQVINGLIHLANLSTMPAILNDNRYQIQWNPIMFTS